MADEVRTRAGTYASAAPRALPLLIVALGACTFWPALRAPRFLDDYLHTLMIAGKFPVPRSPFNLYDFVGDAERALFSERGLLPWWAHPALKLRFLRPISSALMWFEQRVLHFGVGAQHLHSFAWWLACVLGARALFRRLVPERAALIATLIFAFAPCHAMPLAWIANRNALVSIALGLAALASYLGWRARPSLARGLASGVLFSAAVLSGEYALCFGGYVLALELKQHGDAWWRRALALSPFVVPAASYLWVRHALGYGSVGSGFYADPLAEPATFLRAAPFRLAALLGQGWLTVGTETWMIDAPHWLVFPFVLVAGTAMALLLRQVYAALPSAVRADARWLLVGSLLAVCPVLSTVPSPRLMGIALLGIAPNLALVLDHAWFHEPFAPRSRAREYLGIAAAVLGFCHFIHGPVTAWLATSQIRRDASRFVSDIAWVGKRLQAQHATEVVVLRGRVDAFFGPFAMVVGGGPWTRWEVLSDPGHLLTLRRDERTLELVVPRDSSVHPTDWFSLFRGAQEPMRVGEEHRGPSFTARVLSVGELGPTRVRVTFDAPLGPGQLWVSRRDERLRETPPPAIGFGAPSDP